jgi:hypothetical protein
MLIRSSDGMQMTYPRLIWEFLRWKPGMDGMTAGGLYHSMQRQGWPVKLSSLSSQIARLVRTKELAVLPDKTGPRGGKVYVLGEEG